MDDIPGGCTIPPNKVTRTLWRVTQTDTRGSPFPFPFLSSLPQVPFRRRLLPHRPLQRHRHCGRGGGESERAFSARWPQWPQRLWWSLSPQLRVGLDQRGRSDRQRVATQYRRRRNTRHGCPPLPRARTVVRGAPARSRGGGAGGDAGRGDPGSGRWGRGGRKRGRRRRRRKRGRGGAALVAGGWSSAVDTHPQ